MFKVQIDGGHAVLAPIKVEVPAYDLNRNRITYRNR
jgi:translation initiation factor IF-1